MSRKLEYEDYEPDEFEQAYRQEVYDYENPVCEHCGRRMGKVRHNIGDYGYFYDTYECEFC